MISKKFFSVLMLLTVAVCTQAKFWKIGPSSVVGMDFASINAAMDAEEVNAGDTLYLDQYFSTDVKQTVTKKVVIIGTGYDTSLTDEQVVATLTDSLKLMVDGIQVKSVRLANVKFFADECLLDRCYTRSIEIGTVPKGMNYIYSCFITGSVGNQVVASIATSVSGSTTTVYAKAQLDIQNCVFYSSGNQICYLTNSIINNNTNRSTSSNKILNIIDNSQITNNIIIGGSSCVSSDVYAINSGNTIEHNVISQTIQNYPNNKSCSGDAIFTKSGSATTSYSDYFKLKTDVTDNFALTYATDGKEVGCHGGMFGCPSGGRPQYIPYFTKVVVGQRSVDGKLPVNLEVKIQNQ